MLCHILPLEQESIKNLLLKKCAIFYYAINGELSSNINNFNKINNITEYKIRTDLNPVIRRKESFNLTVAK